MESSVDKEWVCIPHTTTCFHTASFVDIDLSATFNRPPNTSSTLSPHQNQAKRPVLAPITIPLSALTPTANPPPLHLIFIRRLPLSVSVKLLMDPAMPSLLLHHPQALAKNASPTTQLRKLPATTAGVPTKHRPKYPLQLAAKLPAVLPPTGYAGPVRSQHATKVTAAIAP